MHRLIFAIAAAFLAMAAAYVGIQNNQLTVSQPVCLAGQFAVLDGHIWWVHGGYQAFNLPGNHTVVLIRGDAMVNGTIFGNYTEVPCK